MKKLYLAIIVSLLVTTNSVDAQLLGRLRNAVVDKVERKVEEKVVEELSEKIANAAVKPINHAIDEMFKERYKDVHGKDFEGDPNMSDEERAQMMATMMSSLFGAVDLPEKYEFDYTLTIEVKDYGDKKGQTVKMLIANDGKAFGFEQMDNSQMGRMVYDSEKDKMVIYNDKDKTVMAMANIMTSVGAMAQEEMKRQDEEIEFKKTSKTKRILGYTAMRYDMESVEDTGEFYIGTGMPFSWQSAFGKMMEKFSPHFKPKSSKMEAEIMNGFVLESISKRKSDNKHSSWEVKKIDSGKVTIRNKDYKNMMDGISME